MIRNIEGKEEKYMRKQKIKRKLVEIMAVGLIMTFLFANCCLATGGIQESSIVTGTQKLITDLTSWLLIIAPAVTILLVGYYFIRKSASDEMDGKRWDNRIKIAIISCIGVVVASGLINVLIGYYQ